MHPLDTKLSERDAETEWIENYSRFETASLNRKRWNPKRRELRIAFLTEGTLADRVFEAARGWEPHMLLQFKKVSVLDNPDIWVALEPGKGHYSAIGTDAKEILRQRGHTMNFGWARTPSSLDIRRVALHEFGHVLSLVHEHQVPLSDIDWDIGAVNAYYMRTQGWTPNEVERYVTRTYNASDLFAPRGFDPHSIMLYPIDRSLVNDPNDAVGWNTRLSLGDKHLAGSLFHI